VAIPSAGPGTPVAGGMKHLGVSAVAFCCLVCPSAAAPPAAEVACRIEYPGSLGVRCSVPLGAAGLLLCGGAGPDGRVRLVAGLDSPFVRAGRLSAAGLLREAAGPLGFDPGSLVSDEATGLRFDGSMSGPQELSVEVILAPETCSLFWLHPETGPGILGCTFGTGGGSLSIEAAAAVCDPGSDGPADGWILDSASIPAGRVLNGASRIGVSLPGLSATISGGISAAERAPPGWFALCTAVLGRGGSGLDLVAAGASATYITLGGGGMPGGLRAGARVRLAGRLARIHARYVLTVGLPGFVPGPFLPSKEELAFDFVRRWPCGVGAWEAGLDLSNRIETGADGTKIDDPTGTLSAGWNSSRLHAGAAVDVDRDGGTRVEVSIDAADSRGRGGAGGQMRCAWPGGGSASLSLSGHCRIVRGSWAVLLEAGVKSVPLGSVGTGAPEPWGSLEWRVTDRRVSPAKGRAP
jgi:hypothetical protein